MTRTLLVLLLLWLLLPAAGWAQPYVPPGRSEYGGKLDTTDSSGAAAGQFRLTRTALHLEISGLLPGGTYSVKLVKVRPYVVEGVGPAPHTFTADSHGTATFDASFLRDPTKEWNLLLIDFHPGGDASDRKTAKPVLRAVLARTRGAVGAFAQGLGRKSEVDRNVAGHLPPLP